jgi:hypothetical protein
MLLFTVGVLPSSSKSEGDNEVPKLSGNFIELAVMGSKEGDDIPEVFKDGMDVVLKDGKEDDIIDVDCLERSLTPSTFLDTCCCGNHSDEFLASISLMILLLLFLYTV